jgi:hypothetical protein
MEVLRSACRSCDRRGGLGGGAGQFPLELCDRAAIGSRARFGAMAIIRIPMARCLVALKATRSVASHSVVGLGSAYICWAPATVCAFWFLLDFSRLSLGIYPTPRSFDPLLFAAGQAPTLIYHQLLPTVFTYYPNPPVSLVATEKLFLTAELCRNQLCDTRFRRAQRTQTPVVSH